MDFESSRIILGSLMFVPFLFLGLYFYYDMVKNPL